MGIYNRIQFHIMPYPRQKNCTQIDSHVIFKLAKKREARLRWPSQWPKYRENKKS